MEVLKFLNWLICLLFAICYAYQIIYIPFGLFGKEKPPKVKPVPHDFAILICARNEAAVIGDLLDSIKRQTYPAERLRVFVMADNCTDDTAVIAARAGATVYERTDTEHVGKGYALDALMRHIKEDCPAGFDGYLVFDADNLLKEDYIEQMNVTFSQGNDIITSYRNSKNYGQNWVSAGYALWFLRESRYLNGARAALNTSCAVSGTGFLFSRAVAEEMDGWPFHLLIEDIEFSIYQIVERGRKIAYCARAELFDEQPIKFRQSWRQRLRWSRGYFQILRHYGGRLLKGIFHGNYACFDMTMIIAPAFILTTLAVVINVTLTAWGVILGGGASDLLIAMQSLGQAMLNGYLLVAAVGGITAVSEWKRIQSSAWRKILSILTFPLFMYTYIPVAIVAIFYRNVGWKPIQHTMSVEQMQAKGITVPNEKDHET